MATTEHSDLIVKAIRTALEEELTRIAEEETKTASATARANIERRSKELVDRMALHVLKNYKVFTREDMLVIEIRKNGFEPEKEKQG